MLERKDKAVIVPRDKFLQSFPLISPKQFEENQPTNFDQNCRCIIKLQFLSKKYVQNVLPFRKKNSLVFLENMNQKFSSNFWA